MPAALSNRYARALVDAVLAPGSDLDPRDAGRQLTEFADMVRTSPELRNVLVSPAVSAQKKRAVISRFAESLPLSRLIRNFLFVLIDRRRAGMLAEIAKAFEGALDERLGVVRAEVASAAPLDDEQRNNLQGELSRVAGKQVRCEFSINSELIGGVVARIGSTVYDGSVRSQLQRLRERLVTS